MQDLIDIFALYLQKDSPSKATTKNYKADVGQFIRWFQEYFRTDFLPKSVTPQILLLYRQEKRKTLSERSVERHISSLRKFFIFLEDQQYIARNPFALISQDAQAMQHEKTQDLWRIKEFKNYLYVNNASDLTIKNYINDIRQFVFFAQKVNDSRNIEGRLVEEFKNRLQTLGMAASSINRKLSAIRKYATWAGEKGIIEKKPELWSIQNIATRIKDISFIKNQTKPESFPTGMVASTFDALVSYPLASLSEELMYQLARILGKSIFKAVLPKETMQNQTYPQTVPNIKKELYAPLAISTRFFPIHKKIWHYLKHNRPEWYKKYHSYTFVHYCHFGILVLFTTTLALALYNSIGEQPLQKETLGTTAIASPRKLSFRGRLTDSANVSVANAADVRFALYNNPVASGSSLLWQETKTVAPDTDGLFSVVLGEKETLPQSLFTNNNTLWIGITVNTDPELIPRQQLANVSYATDADQLQGLVPITQTSATKNVILALDSSGNLTIGNAATPTFQATGGQFTIAGQTLRLTTVAGSGSDVQLSPDTTGMIDFQKPIHNSTNNNNLSAALGSVEIDDTLSVLATTSAQAAFVINQNDTGDLISASSSGIAKFTVTNNGSGFFAGNLGVGTASVSAKLDVEGDIKAKNIAFKSMGSPTGAAISYAFSGSTGIFWPATDAIAIATNGTERIRVDGNGNVGIGVNSPQFKLDVSTNQQATASAMITNTSTGEDADVLALKIGAITAGLGNYFTTFLNGNGEIIGKIQGNGGNGVIFATSGKDFAEYYRKSQREEHLEAGDVVCLDNNGGITRCNQLTNNQLTILGVISDTPGFAGGSNHADDPNYALVGLVGQITTNVSTESGAIKPGDSLTVSSLSGVAMKATQPGTIIGKALEPFSQTSGKILVAVNPGWFDPQVYLTDLGNVSILPVDTSDTNGINYPFDSFGLVQKFVDGVSFAPIHKAGIFSQSVIANLKAGALVAREIVTDTLSAQNKIVSPLAEIDEIHANIISPLSSESLTLKGNVVIEAPATQNSIALTIKDASGAATTTIDSAGNASFSGTLSAQNLTSQEASFSGTLRAKKIIADQIEGVQNAQNTVISGLENQTASSEASLVPEISETPVAYLASFPNIPADAVNIATLSSQLSFVDNLNALSGIFTQGLISLGPASFTDISLIGQLAIGSVGVGGGLVIKDHALNVLGADLELQPLRQGGISFAGGGAYIDSMGNLTVSGNAVFAKDVSVAGTLAAGTISPIADGDLVFHLGNTKNQNATSSASLVIQNASGSAVLTVNQAGDLTASGSASIAQNLNAKSASLDKLNFNLIKPAFAISDTEVVATGSAGIATMSATKKELTIHNSLVTENSLIYITPTTNTDNQVMYLLRQLPGESFTVGIGKPSGKPLPFNWLIVN